VMRARRDLGGHSDLDRNAEGLGLLDALAVHVAGADDSEAAGADLGVMGGSLSF
jgi:hypothetical protein